MTLTASSGGVFEITAAGRLLYSKRKTGIFPEDEAVLAQLRAMQGKQP